MSRIAVMDLWLDWRKLDAVNHVLETQCSSAEKRMEEMFESLYREIVPLPVQERLNKEIQMESEQAAADAAGRTKVTAYRVTGSGWQNCIRTDVGADILIAALQLDRYLSAPAEGDFEDLLTDRTPISDEEYDQLAVLRLENNEAVTGVFDLDFDRGEFSCVDPGEGWRTFHMSSVYNAILRTNQKQGLSHEQRLALLMKNLEGWAVPSPGHLPMQALSFEGNIDVMSGRLVFRIDQGAWFDSLDPVFGTDTCTEENNNCLTVYA